jgi:hypothetical protein
VACERELERHRLPLAQAAHLAVNVAVVTRQLPRGQGLAPVCSKLGMSHALAGTIQKITLAWDERQKARAN